MNKKHTFLSLCDEYDKIEIPIIQRDYAQGRDTSDVVEIRRKFIDNYLIESLINNTHIELDFVYGSVILEKKNTDLEKIFIPLDGQQRLTTLYLLHYFIALKQDQLNLVRKQISKFTYETRPSAKDFCDKLLKIFKPKDLSKIKSEIINSVWFSIDWLNDPTISGMLNMLDTFANNAKLQKYEGDLLSILADKDELLISFYFSDLEQFGLTENLYIRMNARGKMLSDFENFKSEFFKIINYDNDLTNDVKDKIEYKWVENLWDYREKGVYIIDKPFMAYLSFITQMLYFKNAEFRSVKYETNFLDFEVLKSIYSDKDNLVFLIFALDCISDIKALNQPIYWGGYTLDNILEEIIVGKPETIEMFMLYASIQFLFARKDISNIYDYIRVVRNLTYNTDDKSVREWPHLLPSITNLISDKNIYDNLTSKIDSNIFRGFYSEQVKEEKFKATFISNFPFYKKDLFEMEDNNYLQGSITYLLQTPFCTSGDDYNNLSLESINYSKASIEILLLIYRSYIEISNNNFDDIWGDLLNTNIYSYDSNFARVDYDAKYYNCPSIMLFTKKYFDYGKTNSLHDFLVSIEKAFVVQLQQSNDNLEDVKDPKDQLYLYFIQHSRIQKKELLAFFKNGYYNFGWLRKEKGFKSLFTKGINRSTEFEYENPIYQVYNSQFRYNLGLNRNNSLDIEIIGGGKKRNPLQELYEWAKS